MHRQTALVILASCGAFTLLAFIGSPAHGALLLSQSQQSAVTQACPDSALLCRGVQSLLPALSHAVDQAAPFLWYVLASLAALAAVIAGRRMLRRAAVFRFAITPLHLLLCFIPSVWLLFTVLGLDGNARLLPEPTVETFPATAPATLQALRQNFDVLNATGCLGPGRMSDQGDRFHKLAFSCMQRSFLTRVLPQFLVLLLVTLELLVLGRFLLLRLRAPPLAPLVEMMFSVGLGACGWIVLLWLLASFSALRPVVLWPLVVAVPLTGFRHVGYWLRQSVRRSWRIDLRRRAVAVLLGWLLVSLLALNFLHVVRPLPIGFDDLTSYLMRPRAIAALGHSIHSTATFQWEYLTSLGFVLFGHDSTFGATAALMVNWLTGPLAVGAILAFGTTFLRTVGVRQQEVDGRPSQDDSQGRGAGRSKSRVQDGFPSASQPNTYASALGTGGLMAACLYYVLPLVSHFSYADMKVDNAVFAMGSLAALTLFLYLFRSSIAESDPPQKGRRLLLLAGLFTGFTAAMKLSAVMLGAGLLLVLAAVKILDTRRLKPALIAVVVFALGVAVGIGPWLIHNNVRHGNLIPRLVTEGPRHVRPSISIAGIAPDAALPSTRVLPPELAVDVDHANCTSTGRSEELDRYWGTDISVGRHLTLWWRTLVNLDVGGYYVSLIPALLLAPLILLLPGFWSAGARWARWLGIVTVVVLALWTILANGVPWYGIATLLGLLLALEYLAGTHAPRPVRYVAGAFLVASIAIALAMRLTQFANERVMLDYPLGKLSATAMQEVLVPHYADITDMALSRADSVPDRPYLYRVGTYLPYFIADRFDVLGISDNQLSFFSCLYQEKNGPLTVGRLQALGFNSIIFDTGTPSIERDPNGSLHRKVAAFVEFANDPAAGVRTVINDPRHGFVFLLLP